MTISVCMIVKNEEENLERAIASLLGFADELIIVDTGSIDSTKEIAHRYTEKVYDFEMNGDFSAARNYAFARCTMDYIYTADADEVIDLPSQQKILALKHALPEDIEIVQMKYCNQLYLGSVYNYDMEYRPKLFRRLRPFRWIDPIHEIIDTRVHVLDSQIEIIHMPKESHAERDFSAFARVARPGHRLSTRLHRLYAQELYLAGKEEDFLNAYGYFEWTLHEEEFSDEEIKQSQCVVVKCSIIAGDTEGLFRAALKNAIGKPSAEVCCELGRYYQSNGEFEEAAVWYYTAAFGAECELNVHCAGDLPLIGLAACYEELGKPSEAGKYRDMAEQWHDENIEPHPGRC